MSDEQTHQKRLLTLRIIVAAMAGSLLVFGAIAVVLGPISDDASDPQQGQVFLLVLIFFAVSEVVAYAVVRRVHVGRLQANYQQADDSALPEVWQGFMVLTIIGCAMAEGIGLFGLVIVMLEGVGPALAVAFVAWLALLVQFPRSGQFEAFASRVMGRPIE
jgi:F0F1-type ATP synthase membrane subunit c/vacuolar-type H+-ATPase subunit K